MACCKVGRLIDRYSLAEYVTASSVNEQLVDRWLGRGDTPEAGVRLLHRWLNETALRSVYTAHDRHLIDPQLELELEIIQDGDQLDRQSLFEELAEYGIDGDAVAADLVSPTSVYRHLTECLNATKTTEPTRDGWEHDRIDHATDILLDNVHEVLQSLENKDQLPRATDASVDVAIFLECPHCPTRVRIERAIRTGTVCEDHGGHNE